MQAKTGNQQKGFSLIEMMAVVFIVAIAFSLSFVIFSAKSEDRKLTTAIERFTLISQHASEMASVNAEAYGLILEPPEWRDDPLTQGWRYRWQRMTMNGWKDVEALPPEEFSANVELRISIENQEWKYEEEPLAMEPIIGFFPGGDVTPFEIEISHSELDIEAQHVEVNAWGEIVWRERAEAEEENRAFAGDFR